MNEYNTVGLVLDSEDLGEFDKLIHLYTKALGRVAVRAKSLRKINSKLAGHLEPLSAVRLRLVEKNGFRVADAVSTKQVTASKEAVEFFDFIKEMTPELQSDKRLWQVIKTVLVRAKKSFPYRQVLEVLGFNPKFAKCRICDTSKIFYFILSEEVFLCQRCLPKVYKANEKLVSL